MPGNGFNAVVVLFLINFNLVTSPARQASYRIYSLYSALRLRLSASARLGNEPVTASYHIYSGTECEARSIMRAHSARNLA